MANENLSSTVLHEHRRVVTFRHLLALVNFIAIFASSFITRYFVMIRGTSDGILIIINLLCGINILQILLCILDYIIKVGYGKYSSKLVNISYIVGAIWVGMVVAEFIAGTITLGDIRIDLAVIAVFQFVSAIIAYLVWPRIDYSTIRNMTNKNVREDPSKRSKRATVGVVKYILVCSLMIVVQLGLLFAYQLPPKVYDLFSESRQLQYVLSEDGESYEVSGVYQGTSSYVNIPATYNNKPVTKIKSGAISNESVLEKYKIDKIEFGTLQTDADGNEVLVSNVHTIERGAINNDKITTLTLPSSVTKIDNGAIKSGSLKKIVYEARAQFSYPYLECSSLTTVTFSGMDAGKIISLEGMDSSITLEVPKENYNNYREKNSEYMASIRPILSSDEYVVDFYTDTDYYIESIFASAGEVVEIKVSDLKNDKYDNRVAPSVDTNAYIANRHETGTMGSKADSAFRGWYFDRNFTEECDFSGGTLKVSKDTAIYAKWIEEYTGNMVWGQHIPYRPDGSPDTIYWTSEDLVTLPVITDRDGYSGGIVWTVNGQTVRSTQEIFDVYINDNPQATSDKPIAIQGSWMFDTPVADINPSVLKEVNYDISTDKNAVSFVYDETQEAILEGVMSHGYDGVVFSTEWYKDGYSLPISPNKIYRLSDVEESGTYILRVIATSPFGDQSYTDTRIEVNIAKKDLDISGYELKNKSPEYNGMNQTLTDEDKLVDASIGITFEYYGEDGVLLSNNGVRDVGNYTVVVIFAKTDPEEAKNYNTKELSATMAITPKKLTYVGWSADEFVYDSTDKTVRLEFNGVYGEDVVNVIYKPDSNIAKNVGMYTAVATGVDNPNYTISEMENTSHTWKITPKEVTILRWTLDGAITNDYSIVYNGEEHRVEAIPEGVFAADKDSLAFVYDKDAYTVSATDAGTYTAKIIGINNDNYRLSGDAIQNWEITKKTLSVSYDSLSSFTYNGSEQMINATLSGIIANDLDLFSYEKFAFEGMSSGLKLKGEKSENNYVISFSARNAAAYTAKISGILDSADINRNYTVSDNVATLTITPKTVTVEQPSVYTYTGAMQTLEVVVKGIESEDIDGVTYDQFTSAAFKNGKKDGENYLLTMSAKDAGEYAYAIENFNNPNYSFEAVSGTLKIEKKPLSIIWKITDNASGTESVITDGHFVEYNAKGYAIKAEVSGVVGEEVVNLTYENDFGLNAGSYITKVSLPEEYKNYNFEGKDISWSITPYVVDFAWTFNGKEYSVSNGAIPEFTYNAGVVEVAPVYTLLGTDKITISYASNKADLSATNAKTETYKVAISGIDNDNYQIGKNSSFEWRINPKTVSVTWKNETNTVTYNGEYLGPRFTIDGVVENDLYVAVSSDATKYYMDINSIDAATEYDFKSTKSIINAKESGYTCSVVGVYSSSGSGYTKNNNYVVSGNTVDFVVNKAPLTLAGWQYETKGVTSPYSSDVALIYNANRYTLTNAINETLFTRDGVADDVKLAYTNNSASSASTLKTIVYLAGDHKDNYVISGSTELQWSIQQKEVLVNWTINDFVYDGKYHDQYANYERGATSDDDGKVYDVDYLSLSYNGHSACNAGTYTSTIVGINNSNYKLKSGCESYEWTIAQKELNYGKLVWNKSEFTYNASNQYPTASYYDSAVGVTVFVSEYNKAENSKNANGGSDKYVIYATSLHNENYILVGENEGHEYTIVPCVVDFTWGFDTSKYNADNYTYDSIEREVNAYTNAYSGDTINLTYNVESRKIHDAGTYTFTVTGIDNTNYVLNENSEAISKTVTVYPREISLTWGYNSSTSGAGNITYDGSARYLSAHVSNLANGDTEPVLVYSADSARDVLDVGTYKCTVETADYGNYIISSEISKSVTVKAQTINISWSGSNKVTYDGEGHSLVATLTGTINGETVTFVSQYSGDNVFTNVGSYTVQVASYDLDHAAFKSENFVLPSNVSKSIAINKQTLAVDWSGTETLVYDGLEHSLVATITGTISGKSVQFITQYTGANTFTNAGTYTVKIDSYDLDREGFLSSNFALPSNTSKTLTIKKQTLNVTWSGTRDLTYDGETHSLVATIQGTVAGKTVTATPLYQNGINSGINAGTYTIKVSDITNPTNDAMNLNNFAFPTDGSTSATLKIQKREVNISWSGNADVVYDGNVHRLVATVTGENDKIVAFNYSNNQKTDVGTYDISISLIDTTNYVLPASGTVKPLTINPQSVSITWSGTGKHIYRSAGYIPTVSVVGKNDGKVVSFSMTNTTAINVGTYAYEVVLNDYNYTLENCEGSTKATIEIEPQPVVVTWSGSTNIVYDGSKHKLTATVVGKEDAKSVSFTYNTTLSNSSVGRYTYTITLSNSNYTFADEDDRSRTMVIDPQPVNITWTSPSEVVYDGKYHSLTAKVVGRNNSTPVSFNYSSTATHADVGTWTYYITLSNSNYTIDEMSGSTTNTLNILPQPVKISWSGNDTYKYTGEVHSLTYTVVGKNTGVIVTDYCYGSGIASFMNVGMYSYTILGINNTNYTLENCDGYITESATILPMDVTIEWIGDTIVTYDGNAHSIQAVVKDEFGNEISIGYKNGNSITDIGTKTVIISFDNLEANYNVVSGEKHQTITVVAPTVPAEPEDPDNE